MKSTPSAPWRRIDLHAADPRIWRRKLPRQNVPEVRDRGLPVLEKQNAKEKPHAVPEVPARHHGGRSLSGLGRLRAEGVRQGPVERRNPGPRVIA